MTDLAQLARSVLDMASRVTPFIPGTADDAAVAAAKAVVNVIDRTREITSADSEELRRVREELAARVPGELRDEASKLRGG